MMEVIASDNPRAKTAEMKKAIRAEVDGLMSRNGFKVVNKRDVPQNANLLPYKYVIAAEFGEKKAQRDNA